MWRIALAQINTTVGDLGGNLDKMLKSIAQARDRGAVLVTFPEMALTGYPPEDLLLKDHFVRDQLKALRRLLARVRGIVVVVGFVDRAPGGKLYNAAAVVAQGKMRGVYHKQALPNYGVFDEKRYFCEGTGDPVFFLNGVPFGVTICEDIWGEGVPARRQSRKGARVLINISASPYDFGKLQERQNLIRRLARETGAFVCYNNLIGGQDELVFDGGGLVVTPQGRIAASGAAFEEDLIVVDLPVRPATRKRREYIMLPDIPVSEAGYGSLPARRISSGKPIERVFRALVLGTRDYVRKNGFQKVLVGLSGGIDSSLVAAVAREALGRDNVVGVSMPSGFSSQETQSDAARLAKNLGIRFYEIPIQNVFDGFLASLPEDFRQTAPSLAEENLQARIRGNILMALSNKFGWLVLTTGNKSEVAVGYCTLYGDMSGGFAVIKDVPKIMVYDLARFINATQGDVIPASVLTRPPTAELRADQKDEDSLPPYDQLDPILAAYVEGHRSVAGMARGHKDPDLIREVIRMVDKSEYKRRQAPPGVKITPRAFGKDWRLPITNRYENS